MLTNYHTHTTRSGHAEGTEEEYILTALRCGFKVLGFSDHTPWAYATPGFVSRIRMLPSQLDDYVLTLRGLREKYADKLHIRIGLEAEYFPAYLGWLREEMERLGIYADVSHLSDPGFWELYRMTERPIVASHSNARALCPQRRNLTDDMFRAIRDTGGVVGLNLYRGFVGGASMDALAAHVEHFLHLDGEKTLCIGGDLDGCEALAAGMNGAEDVPQLYEALEKQGYGKALLEDIFWNNLRRLL